MIELKNVSKTFITKDSTVEAVKNVSLDIEDGSIYGIIGYSGAGKSTLVRCINLLERPDSGDVIIDGENMEQLSAKELRQKRAQIGMIFQNFNLLMQKSVIENVCFPLVINGAKKRAARSRAKELLEIVGLSDKADEYPAKLSGGQKQRVAIARALADNPKILLCDEATSALDSQTTASILELLKRINGEFRITIVMITHQMPVIRQICTDVALVEGGEIVEAGKVEDIFNHPKSKMGRELIFGGAEEEDVLIAEEVKSDNVIRIVFSGNSAFEPVIANAILTFKTPINILKADTKNLNGKAVGEMILALPQSSQLSEEIKKHFAERGLEIEEVTANV